MKECLSCLLAGLSVLTIAWSKAYAKNGENTAVASSNPQQVASYPNTNLLVTTELLAKNLESENLAILDARSKGYEQSHIRGAVNLKYSDCVGRRGIRCVKDLETRLSALGLRQDMKYVIYDDGTLSDGGAGGVFWVMEYLGCKDVHILNGGWGKWVLEHRPVASEAGRLKASTFVAAPQEAIRKTRDQISNRLGSKDFIIIDARNDESYNGWKTDGEKRGGHIPGAVNIKYTWFYGPDKSILGYEDLKSLLESRGISGEKEVCAYCATGTRSGFTYFILRLMGYPGCSNYDGGMVDWTADANRPLRRLPRYEKLVYPGWVKDLIDGKNPPSYPGKGYVILETRYTGFSVTQPGAAQAGEYIPGAIAIDPGYVEHGADTSRYFPNYTQSSDAHVMNADRLRDALAKLGITGDKTVIVYGNGKIIPMIAARVAWALMYAGVEDVRIMNGGFPAWVEAGYPIASIPAKPVPTSDFGSKFPVHREYLATTDYVRRISAGRSGHSVIVDCRKLEEYQGETNSYPFFHRKGHIPKAIWTGGYFSMTNPDNTFRSYTEVRENWRKRGITPDSEPVFYCGTGWRSSVGFFEAYLMGYATKNYDGGFYDWTWDVGDPVAVSR